MRQWYGELIPALWIAWFIYWRMSAAGVKPIARVESPLSRAAHFVPLIVAGLLLWMRRIADGGVLFERFIARSFEAYWSGVALVVAGLIFSIWARRTIGRNWSGTVTVKQDHELITSGPYALVRHPIYTGLLLMFIGSAIARGEWRGVVAVVIVLVALWRKLRLEERFMTETFGDAYRRYREHTAALIPWLL
ncbi:MAG TPA: isoprenylcysteine carboxylmethyltransferase family protein [Steroidobacteraceae bacterium]|jgi:protein-S-isoprenylcysteine O-methyltransferase Ste14